MKVARPTRAGLLALLSANALPTDDLASVDLGDFFCTGMPEAPRAVIGFQCETPRDGAVALLRSLAVDDAAKGQGHGKELVGFLEQHCSEQGIQALFLLTTTAEAFFAALGYHVVPRSQVPAAIQATDEFSSLCPASAVVMRKALS